MDSQRSADGTQLRILGRGSYRNAGAAREGDHVGRARVTGERDESAWLVEKHFCIPFGAGLRPARLIGRYTEVSHTAGLRPILRKLVGAAQVAGAVNEEGDRRGTVQRVEDGVDMRSIRIVT